MKKQIFKGKVKYDEMNINFDIPFECQHENLTEDLVQVEYDDGLLLDIGWYPEGDPDGEIAVLVVQNYDWDNPVYEERCNDLPSLLNIIKAAERIISNNAK